jgi:hypothetical protein
MGLRNTVELTLVVFRLDPKFLNPIIYVRLSVGLPQASPCPFYCVKCRTLLYPFGPRWRRRRFLSRRSPEFISVPKCVQERVCGHSRKSCLQVAPVTKLVRGQIGDIAHTPRGCLIPALSRLKLQGVGDFMVTFKISLPPNNRITH